MADWFKNIKSRTSKHEKLRDKWGDYKHQDKVSEGVTYIVTYLGSTLVEELHDDGESYGDRISGKAIDSIMAMARAGKKKLQKMSVEISPRGIRITDTETQRICSDLDIYRICFCTADRTHGKVFAYIARNKENETMECHAFLCPERKVAEAVALTVAESFKLARDVQEHMDDQRRQEQLQQQPCGRGLEQPLLGQSPQKSHVVVEQHPSPTSPTCPSPTMGFEDNFADMKVGRSGHVTVNSSSSSPVAVFYDNAPPSHAAAYSVSRGGGGATEGGSCRSQIGQSAGTATATHNLLL